MSSFDVNLIAVVLLALLGNAAVRAALDVSRVHFIDRVRPSADGLPNYLFRSNLPESDGKFQYDALKQALALKATREANVTLPRDYELVIVNLLNVAEFEDTDVEKAFFKAHPRAGRLVHWPIIGNVLGPDAFPHGVMKYMAEHLSTWQFDDLPSTMTRLRAQLESAAPTNRSAVFVVHCEAGEDRTGEVSGSYYMSYLNWTFHEALAYDDHNEDRLIKTMSRNGLQWYCEYLKYKLHTQSDCSIPKNESAVAPSPLRKALQLEAEHQQGRAAAFFKTLKQ